MKVNVLLAGAATLLILTTLGVSGQLPVGAGDPLPGITPSEFEAFRIGIRRAITLTSGGITAWHR